MNVRGDPDWDGCRRRNTDRWRRHTGAAPCIPPPNIKEKAALQTPHVPKRKGEAHKEKQRKKERKK